MGELAERMVPLALNLAGRCRRCGRQRKPRIGGGLDGAREMCRPCYDAEKTAGFPEEMTPLDGMRPWEARMEDYAFARDDGDPPEEAARRVRVSSPTTVAKYERWYQGQRKAVAA